MLVFQRELVCFFYLVMVFFCVGKANAQFESSKVLEGPEEILLSLKGEVVEIRFARGFRVSQLQVMDVKYHPELKQLVSLKVKELEKTVDIPGDDGERKRNRNKGWIRAKKIEEIYVSGVPLDLSYDRKSKTLFHDVEKRQRRRKSHDEAVLRLSKIRRGFWPIPDPKKQKVVVAKLKLFVDGVKKEYKELDFRTRESRSFLLLSDVPNEMAEEYLKYLDSVYLSLCQAFGLCPKKNIWSGRCVVILFKKKESFFKAMKSVSRTEVVPNLEAYSGFCFPFPDGRIVILAYAGQDTEQSTLDILAHEVTHGFFYRYKSNVLLPNWLNEGISEWVAAKLSKNRVHLVRCYTAAKKAIKQRTWGKAFLKTKMIKPWQYGVSEVLVDVLIRKQKGREFRQLVDSMKEGVDQEEALKATYKMDFQQLEAFYLKYVEETLKKARKKGDSEPGSGKPDKGQVGSK